jgi:ribose 5-phosphate isomerase A
MSFSFITFTPEEISNYDAKLALARQVAERAKSGDVIGAGSGSTSYLTLLELGRRCAEGELADLLIVPTSYEVTFTAMRLGLTTVELATRSPDWVFDGADEVDPAARLIKGRGGALLRERLVFDAAAEILVMVDASKLVTRLGSRFPVPVEVVPAAAPAAVPQLLELGASTVEIRRAGGKDGPVITEAGNLLIDCTFSDIPLNHSHAIAAITGVVGSGLFEGYQFELITPA